MVFRGSKYVLKKMKIEKLALLKYLNAAHSQKRKLNETMKVSLI